MATTSEERDLLNAFNSISQDLLSGTTPDFVRNYLRPPGNTGPMNASPAPVGPPPKMSTVTQAQRGGVSPGQAFALAEEGARAGAETDALKSISREQFTLKNRVRKAAEALVRAFPEAILGISPLAPHSNAVQRYADEFGVSAEELNRELKALEVFYRQAGTEQASKRAEAPLITPPSMAPPAEELGYGVDPRASALPTPSMAPLVPPPSFQQSTADFLPEAIPRLAPGPWVQPKEGEGFEPPSGEPRYTGFPMKPGDILTPNQLAMVQEVRRPIIAPGLHPGLPLTPEELAEALAKKRPTIIAADEELVEEALPPEVGQALPPEVGQALPPEVELGYGAGPQVSGQTFAEDAGKEKDDPFKDFEDPYAAAFESAAMGWLGGKANRPAYMAAVKRGESHAFGSYWLQKLLLPEGRRGRSNVSYYDYLTKGRHIDPKKTQPFYDSIVRASAVAHESTNIKDWAERYRESHLDDEQIEIIGSIVRDNPEFEFDIVAAQEGITGQGYFGAQRLKALRSMKKYYDKRLIRDPNAPRMGFAAWWESQKKKPRGQIETPQDPVMAGPRLPEHGSLGLGQAVAR